MKRSWWVPASFMLAAVIVASPLQAQPAAAPPAQPGPAAASAPATNPAGGTPRIRIDEKVYDFGEIQEGDKVEHDFIVHNDGDAPLEIPKVQASCGCTASQWDRKIEPGGQGKVHVVFNTRGKGTTPKTVAYVQSNDPAQPRLEIRLEGKARRLIDLEPPRGFQFGRILGQNVKPLTVKVTSNLTEPLNLELQQVPPHAEHLAVDVKDVEPGKVFEVTVTPRTPLPEGSTNTTVQFKTNAPQMPTLAIPVQLFVPPAVEVFPPTIMLGAPPPNETLRNIDIVLNDQGQMKVLSVASSDPAIQPTLLETVAGRRFQVRCMIPAGFNLGHDQKAEIRIATDHPVRKDIVVPISMRPLPQQTQAPSVRFTFPPTALVGKPAPQATLRSVSAREIKIGQSTGRVTALTFWTIDCTPCTRQLPLFQRLFASYQARGVDFVAVNADGQATSAKVVNKAMDYGLRMEVAVDADLAVAAAYGASTVPALYLVGQGGQVEAVHVGMPEDAAAVQQLEKTLGEQLDLLLAGKTLKDYETPKLTLQSVPVLRGAAAASSIIPDRPVLELGAVNLNLGELKPGQVVRQSVFFRNGGARPLEITRVAGPDALKIDGPGADPIAPGAAGSLQVEVKAPENPGSFTETLTVESNDPARPSLTVTLAGTVTPLVGFTPPAGADFGRRPEMHAMPRTVTLAYTGQGPIKYLKAESTSPAFLPELQQQDGASSARLTVTPKGPFEEGEHTALILVTTDCPQQPVVEVPVNLVVPGRVDVNPVELVYIQDFRRVQRRSTTIRVGGDRPVHILAVRRSQENIQTQLHPDADGRSYQLHVTVPADFVPSGDGDTVVLETDDAEYGRIVVSLVFRSAAEVQRLSRLGPVGG